GRTYSVTVLTQPPGQTCAVANGSGTVSGANILNVGVNCVTNTYKVGGSVSGLSGSLVLQNNGADNRTISASGTFTCSTALPSGSPYNVTVLTQPSGQNCTVVNGAGTVSGADVSNVGVNCLANTYTVGGTVSGLSGSIVLQNNGGNNRTVSANGGGFIFPALQNGSLYNVTVFTKPTG